MGTSIPKTSTWSTTVSSSTIKPKTTTTPSTITKPKSTTSNKMTAKSTTRPTTITSTVKAKTSIVNIVNLKTVLLSPIETTLFPKYEKDQKKPVILWSLVS